MIHQNAPHRLSGNGEETVAIHHGQLTLVQEPTVDLVNKRGRREGVTRRFTSELPPGDLTQLVVASGTSTRRGPHDRQRASA